MTSNRVQAGEVHLRPEPNRIIQEAVGLYRETAAVEFKGPMSWEDRRCQAKVIKSALAMSNRRNGGVIVFGLEDEGSGGFSLKGLDEQQSATFTQDSVSSTVNRHAAPHIALEVIRDEKDGHRLIGIVVAEFDRLPVICCKDFQIDGKVVITSGRLYCRSNRMPESTEVTEPEQLRQILEIATEKAVAWYRRLKEVDGSEVRLADADAFATREREFFGG